MKRDMDLLRQMLVELEDCPEANGAIRLEFKCEHLNRTQEEIGYHLSLLHQAGLINAADRTQPGDKYLTINILGLTWDGHEFLDASRDPSRWDKAKQIVKEKAGGLAFELLKAALLKMAMDAISGTPLP